jgi:type IV secretory pathway TraG/TraD family ATPase VirD4
MAVLDPKSDAFEADCENIAQAIVRPIPGDHNAHFTDSARQLVGGAIMHLKTNYPPEDQNLAYMRQAVTTDIFTFADKAMKTGTPGVKQRLARFGEQGANLNREIISMVSTANTATGFLGIKAIADSVSGSDFQSFRDLRRGPKPITIY